MFDLEERLGDDPYDNFKSDSVIWKPIIIKSYFMAVLHFNVFQYWD